MACLIDFENINFGLKCCCIRAAATFNRLGQAKKKGGGGGAKGLSGIQQL